MQDALHMLVDAIYLESDTRRMTGIESKFFYGRGEIIDLTNRRQRNSILTEAVNICGTERQLWLVFKSSKLRLACLLDSRKFYLSAVKER